MLYSSIHQSIILFPLFLSCRTSWHDVVVRMKKHHHRCAKISCKIYTYYQERRMIVVMCVSLAYQRLFFKIYPHTHTLLSIFYRMLVAQVASLGYFRICFCHFPCLAIIYINSWQLEVYSYENSSCKKQCTEEWVN